MIELKDAKMAEPRTGLTCRIRVDLIERVRNSIWWTGQGMTISKVIEDGLTHWVENMEKSHNKGKPFAQREGELPFSPKK